MRPGEAFGDGCEIIVCDGILNHPGPHFWLDSGRHHFLPLDDDTAVERLAAVCHRQYEAEFKVGVSPRGCLHKDGRAECVEWATEFAAALREGGQPE